MGAMKRYIAALSPVARDRLIAAKVWLPNTTSDGKGGGCLRGHAEGFTASGLTMSEINAIADRPDYRKGQFEWHDREAMKVLASTPEYWDVIHRFNESVQRWPDRTVRAIKAYAAKLNGSTQQEIEALMGSYEGQKDAVRGDGVVSERVR